MELDSLDRKLLAELDNNARQTFSELGRKLRVGSDLVSYRYRRLEGEGIIRGTSLILNPAALGVDIVKAYLKLSNRNRDRKRLLKQLMEGDEPCWMASVFGSWDLAYSIYADSADDYQRKIRTVFGSNLELIREMKTFQLIEQFKDSYQFESGRSRGATYFGPSAERIELNDLDREILFLLGKNSRSSLVEIGNSLAIAPNVAGYRLQQLEKKGVIAGYVLNVDHERLGLLRFKVAVRTPLLSASDEKLIVAYLRKLPQIFVVVRQLGAWSLEFDVLVSSIEGLTKIIDELREEFPETIEDLEFVVYRPDPLFRTPKVKRFASSASN